MPTRAYVVTSERAGHLPPVRPRQRERVARRLLKTGHATLRAIAIAYYGGDMAEAKRWIYSQRLRAA